MTWVRSDGKLVAAADLTDRELEIHEIELQRRLLDAQGESPYGDPIAEAMLDEVQIERRKREMGWTDGA